MQSSKRAETLDTLEQDVPTTPQDNVALWRARQASYQMTSHEYLAFLLAFTHQHPPDREIPPFHEPFEL